MAKTIYDAIVNIEGYWHQVGVALPTKKDTGNLVLSLNPLLDLSRLPAGSTIILRARSEKPGRSKDPYAGFPDDFGKDDIPF